MNQFDLEFLKQLYLPSSFSHKGQNGKLLMIVGSKLFHAAALWPLTVASRIVDMVFFASTTSNNEIVQKQKEVFPHGIVVPRNRMEEYIQEAECILIGPGLPRDTGREEDDEDTKKMTEELLRKYPHKQWVIDGGSLQTMDPFVIPYNAIITPHRKEFYELFKSHSSNFKFQINEFNVENDQEIVQEMAKKFNCIIVLKGQRDIVCSSTNCVMVLGGNAGMTKGGTGDVLAGLIAALACKNAPFLAACCGSYINKKAGDKLYEKMGFFYNASDLAEEIPIVLKEELLHE